MSNVGMSLFSMDGSMLEQITGILTEAKILVDQASSLSELEHIRVTFLGKKGKLTEILKQLGQLSAEERPKVGQEVNQAKAELQTLLSEKQTSFKRTELNKQLSQESIDVTLPGRRSEMGSLHPVTLVRRRVEALFADMGFEVSEGPEIEDDFHNFESLNFEENHPAKAAQDTFYFPDGTLLRTHTSPVQIRYMQDRKPPIRMIAPGRVYRCDFDATHTPMFHQVEGLMIDTHINFAQLKGLLKEFIDRFFERDMNVRFRPSYFPFTEPSAEVDMEFKKGEWLEILGCGMVHPNVLKAVKIDPEKYQGYAFGLGLDRLAMLYFGIEDLRTLFENDIRFLEQF